MANFQYGTNEGDLKDYGEITSAVYGLDKTKLGVENTTTAVINPIFSSQSRVASTADAPHNFNISELSPPPSGKRSLKRGLLRGRRPNFGLLFPRGVYGR